MKIRFAHPLSASAAGLTLLLISLGGAEAQSGYTIVSFSTGASGGPSSGGNYSLSRTAGLGDFCPMQSARYKVEGNFWPGMVVAPALDAGGFYIGIDLHDPAQAMADYDGDGVSNLMEYGLGTDPRNGSDASQAMLVSMSAQFGGKFLTLQFKRRNNATALGLQYVPEVSADGQTWFSDTAHVLEVQVIALDTQFDWVTVRDQSPTTAGAPRFFRLRILQN